MTDFTLTAYLVAGSTSISGAFGSDDPALKSHVLTQTAPLIEQAADDAAHQRVSDGLDLILATPHIRTYDYNVALGIEMLYAAHATAADNATTATILGFTEDCLPALSALEMPAFYHAVDVLAWGQEVALPVPMGNWSDVTGQYYFDASAQAAAIAELDRLADFETTVITLADNTPDAMADCHPNDLIDLLDFMHPLLLEAQGKQMDIAVFRHGGV